MADLRFFSRKGPFLAAEIARECGCELLRLGDPKTQILDVAPLDQAGAEHLSFFDNIKYLEQFKVSKAGFCVVRQEYVDVAPPNMVLLVSKDPYRAYALCAQKFYPETYGDASIASSAVIAPSAKIGKNCKIEHGVVIGDRVEIGEQTIIGANTVIGDGVVVGKQSRIAANVTLSHCILGERVSLLPGVRVGQDGFGFAMGAGGHVKVPQLGRVIIGDDVEIGANVCVDRGAGPDTKIGNGTKIDNLVQIAHNVQIGSHCIIVAACAIGGSTHIGDFVVMGAQVGLAGHLKIGSGVKIAAQSGVMRDIPAGTSMGGTPAMPQREWLQQIAWLAKMVRGKKQ